MDVGLIWWGMDLDKLRESSEKSGVKELWARKVSAEVEEAWQRAQDVLEGELENKRLER